MKILKLRKRFKKIEKRTKQIAGNTSISALGPFQVIIIIIIIIVVVIIVIIILLCFFQP